MVWRVPETEVRDFVEHYSTLYSNEHSDRIVEMAYKNYVREPLRTFACDEIQKLDGLMLKEQVTPIGETISQRVTTLTTNGPFKITSVVVGNIQYPDQVSSAVAEKLSAASRARVGRCRDAAGLSGGHDPGTARRSHQYQVAK